MEEFLKSLGIFRDENTPEICPICNAKWPYCNWDDIVEKAPCANEPKEKSHELQNHVVDH